MGTQSVMDRLREETRPDHEKAEASDFGTAVMSKSISLEAYTIHIAAHYEVLRAIEEVHAASDSERIAMVWHDGLSKAPLLEEDLRFLAFDAAQMPVETAEAVNRFVAMVQRRNVEAHESLPGVLYVLEGSTMGGSILRKMIAEALGFSSDHGLNYYSVYGNDVRKHFMDFKSRMSAAYDGSGHEDALVEAAKETFDLIGEVFRSIPLEHTDSMQGQSA